MCQLATDVAQIAYLVDCINVLVGAEHKAVLSVGPISHNNIHLLIITTDFVALYRFTGYVVFIITSFLVGVESGDQRLLNSEVLSCFSGS